MKHVVPIDRVIIEIICVQPMVACESIVWHYLPGRPARTEHPIGFFLANLENT
jgi:hypothetical protein